MLVYSYADLNRWLFDRLQKQAGPLFRPRPGAPRPVAPQPPITPLPSANPVFSRLRHEPGGAALPYLPQNSPGSPYGYPGAGSALGTRARWTGQPAAALGPPSAPAPVAAARPTGLPGPLRSAAGAAVGAAGAAGAGALAGAGVLGVNALLPDQYRGRPAPVPGLLSNPLGPTPPRSALDAWLSGGGPSPGGAAPPIVRGDAALHGPSLPAPSPYSTIPGTPYGDLPPSPPTVRGDAALHGPALLAPSPYATIPGMPYGEPGVPLAAPVEPPPMIRGDAALHGPGMPPAAMAQAAPPSRPPVTAAPPPAAPRQPLPGRWWSPSQEYVHLGNGQLQHRTPPPAGSPLARLSTARPYQPGAQWPGPGY